MVAGLVKGEGFAVDASVMEANANRYHAKRLASWPERAVHKIMAGHTFPPMGQTIRYSEILCPSLPASRMTILSASSGNGRCSALASSHGARIHTSSAGCPAWPWDELLPALVELSGGGPVDLDPALAEPLTASSS
jgi:hypothetical protein